MRLALLIAVLGPGSLLLYPVTGAPGQGGFYVDVVGLVCGATLLTVAVGRPIRSRSWWRLIGAVALVWVLVDLLMRFDTDFPYPGGTSWTLAVAASLLFGAVDEWFTPEHAPMPSAPAAAALAFTAAAVATPLVGGLEGLPEVPVIGILTVAAVAVGLLYRQQRLRLVRQRVEVRDRERREMARELHDVIAHEVAGIVVLVQGARATTNDPTTAQLLARIEGAGERALQGLRVIVATSRQETGSGSADTSPHRQELVEVARLVEDFAHTTSATVQLHRSGDERVTTAIAAAAYRIVAESLSNVRRHAHDARRVDVVIDSTGADLVLEVRDDGTSDLSNEPAELGGGWGLPGIAERADLVGGRVETGPRPEGGWRVRAVLPKSVVAKEAGGS